MSTFETATPQVRQALQRLAELDDAAPGAGVAALDEVHRLLQAALDELDEA